MATTDDTTTPPEPGPAATVTELPTPPVPEVARLSVNIPTDLMEWLEEQMTARMVGKPFLVVRALEKLRDELPPA